MNSPNPSLLYTIQTVGWGTRGTLAPYHCILLCSKAKSENKKQHLDSIFWVATEFHFKVWWLLFKWVQLLSTTQQ